MMNKFQNLEFEKIIQAMQSMIQSRFFRAVGKLKWHRLILVILLAVTPYLAFHNLEINPRPWQDEGAYLSVAKTLVTDGVYAVKNSDDYQTFGPIQSVGPTVILPVAIIYKLFGIGLLQGRIVIVIMSFITGILFYFVGKELFGSESSTLALLLLLGSPAVEYLLVSRQVIGENVALGFFLGGVLLMSKGLKNRQYIYFALAGVLFGVSMVTKAQYSIMIFGALLTVFILDLFYYRQVGLKLFVVIGLFAFSCVVGWWAWQYNYFGAETFQQNAEKLRQLSLGTGGLNLHNTVDAIRFLIGTGSGHYYYFLGIPALIYMGLMSLKRDRKGFLLGFLMGFCTVWLAYYLLWTNPWLLTVYAPMAISAIFVGKVWSDLINALKETIQNFSQKNLKEFLNPELPLQYLLPLGTLLIIVMLTSFTFYDIQRAVKVYVVDRVGVDRAVVRAPSQLEIPYQVADYLQRNVGTNMVVETWERELGILTDLTYHYPDQSLLGDTYGAIYRGQPRTQVLGAEYFQAHNPSYLVIGWFARSNNLYDTDYLSEHAVLIATFGSNEWRYDVYELDSSN